MILIFFVELLILFFLSRLTSRELSKLFYKILRSQKISIFLISIIFLPGTIVHELSHAIMAKILFVHVGKIELTPSLDGDSLKLGSVQVGQSDVFRNFFIGIAPFLSGTAILVSILYFTFSNNIYGLNLFTGGIIYFIFVIANTMYSSGKDMEGAIEFFAIILIPIIIFYFLGIKIDTKFMTSLLPFIFIQQAVFLMMIPIFGNIAIIVFAKILNRS